MLFRWPIHRKLENSQNQYSTLPIDGKFKWKIFTFFEFRQIVVFSFISSRCRFAEIIE